MYSNVGYVSRHCLYRLNKYETNIYEMMCYVCIGRPWFDGYIVLDSESLLASDLPKATKIHNVWNVTAEISPIDDTSIELGFCKCGRRRW
jgi:hypothetical protein